MLEAPIIAAGSHAGAIAAFAPNARAIRDRIARLEAAMHAAPEKLHLEPVHRFAQGLYARELTLPAGCIGIGHIHGQEHLCIISQGRVEVISETAGARIIEAPATFVVPRGTKNCVRAITDTVWTTIHATEETDVAKIEAAVLLPCHPDEIERIGA